MWLATPAQIAVLDRCEGRDDRFRLARLRTGEVRTDDGARVDGPWPPRSGFRSWSAAV